MKSDPLNPTTANRPDVSLSLATLIGGAFLILLLWLQVPKQTKNLFHMAGQFINANPESVWFMIGLILFNLIWMGQTLRALSSNSKLKSPQVDPGDNASRLKISHIIVGAIASSLVVLIPIGFKTIEIATVLERQFPKASDSIDLGGIVLLTITWAGCFISFATFYRWVLPRLRRHAGLPRLPKIRDGIILGAINEIREEGSFLAPAWVTMGFKALTGNLLIAGVIGSGKSQVLLQILRQSLSQFTTRPALLAIDPKRTFVRELRKIIQTLGMEEHLLWIELNGSVKLNPIWREQMLKNSRFTTIANTLRLASINFLGSSSDNRFWEQSSFNLLKNSLIYCAAKYDYFTFKDLYRALIQARDEGLAGELVDELQDKLWDAEERSNIEMAISYFSNEFSRMDEKVRTSVLATATSFLNEFLEYSVAAILSPRRDDITVASIRDSIDEGKLICLHIENDSLARSIGTLIKLMYEEAVLDRVGDPNHSQARYALLVMDEYQDVATSGGGAGLGDDRFLAKARESKAITIAATQSVSSLENAIRSEAATRELLQNFRSRVLGNTTDTKTIRLFQEPHGMQEVERLSHSRSKNSQDARRDYLFGGIDSKQANISESVSTQFAQEHKVTAREFSRLKTFEAYAQIFDGLETRFEKLFLKPYYLKTMRTSHKKILNQLRETTQVPNAIAMGIVIIGACLISTAHADALFPNVCTVVKTNEFQSCLDLSITACTCGFPIPRPCAKISYYVPQTFIEVWPNSQDTYFSKHPAVAQLKAYVGTSRLPFGTDDESGSFSFQAHAIPAPMAAEILIPLPCGGTRLDKPCFDALSEDFGSNWKTGKADSLQPFFLAWGLSPKACVLKGAALSAFGGASPSLGADTGGCSSPLGSIPLFPPSNREACNGWGLFYPRSGVYDGGSRTAAALMIAARLKSLGTDVLHTIPGDLDEVWQMITPQSSSCFREGQNIGLLETIKGVREEKRLIGKPNGYLFVIWKKVSCCRDLQEVGVTLTAIAGIRAACALL